MKNVILILLIVFCGCKTMDSKEIIKSNPATEYKVYKIKSIEKYYLIYAKRNDSVFKIISQKLNIVNCNKIRTNKYYSFKLHSILKDRFKNTKLRAPANDLNITCFTFEGNVQICKEKGIDDLYYADNLKDLCLGNVSN